MEEKHIAILLATYNGEQYIRQQLDSIFLQDWQNWTLYVCDDGSTDATLDIVNEYSIERGKIIIIDRGTEKGRGPRDNFMHMLHVVEADYYFFCDQDDYWLPNKITLEMNTIVAEEEKHPCSDDVCTVPVVVFTDLKVADSELNVINDSMWNYSNIYPYCIKSFKECVRTVATGCTMCFNRMARTVADKAFEKAMMHDCWVYLCVMSSGGTCVPLSDSTILYRQHIGNSVGAKEHVNHTLAYKIRDIKRSMNLEWKYYSMLRTLGYGSILKYIRESVRYRRRCRRL